MQFPITIHTWESFFYGKGILGPLFASRHFRGTMRNILECAPHKYARTLVCIQSTPIIIELSNQLSFNVQLIIVNYNCLIDQLSCHGKKKKKKEINVWHVMCVNVDLQHKWTIPSKYKHENTCVRMLYFLVIPLLWVSAELFEAGVGVSSVRADLMEFALDRASDLWDVPILNVATRSARTHHLLQVTTSILEKQFCSNTKGRMAQEDLKRANCVTQKWKFSLNWERSCSVHVWNSPVRNTSSNGGTNVFCKSATQTDNCHPHNATFLKTFLLLNLGGKYDELNL